MLVRGLWGLQVAPKKIYKFRVESSFKITMATLYEFVNNKRTSVYLSFQDKSFLLCSLTPEKIEQQMVDITCLRGEIITLRTEGSNGIHLLGNYISQDNDDDDESAEVYSINSTSEINEPLRNTIFDESDDFDDDTQHENINIEEDDSDEDEIFSGLRNRFNSYAQSTTDQEHNVNIPASLENANVQSEEDSPELISIKEEPTVSEFALEDDHSESSESDSSSDEDNQIVNTLQSSDDDKEQIEKESNSNEFTSFTRLLKEVRSESSSNAKPRRSEANDTRSRRRSPRINKIEQTLKNNDSSNNLIKNTDNLEMKTVHKGESLQEQPSTNPTNEVNSNTETTTTNDKYVEPSNKITDANDSRDTPVAKDTLAETSPESAHTDMQRRRSPRNLNKVTYSFRLSDNSPIKKQNTAQVIDTQNASNSLQTMKTSLTNLASQIDAPTPTVIRRQSITANINHMTSLLQEMISEAGKMKSITAENQDSIYEKINTMDTIVQEAIHHVRNDTDKTSRRLNVNDENINKEVDIVETPQAKQNVSDDLLKNKENSAVIDPITNQDNTNTSSNEDQPKQSETLPNPLLIESKSSLNSTSMPTKNQVPSIPPEKTESMDSALHVNKNEKPKRPKRRTRRNKAAPVLSVANASIEDKRGSPPTKKDRTKGSTLTQNNEEVVEVPAEAQLASKTTEQLKVEGNPREEKMGKKKRKKRKRKEKGEGMVDLKKAKTG